MLVNKVYIAALLRMCPMDPQYMPCVQSKVAVSSGLHGLWHVGYVNATWFNFLRSTGDNLTTAGCLAIPSFFQLCSIISLGDRALASTTRSDILK